MIIITVFVDNLRVYEILNLAVFKDKDKRTSYQITLLQAIPTVNAQKYRDNIAEIPKH